jgi:hypothetical protein
MPRSAIRGKIENLEIAKGNLKKKKKITRGNVKLTYFAGDNGILTLFSIYFFSFFLTQYIYFLLETHYINFFIIGSYYFQNKYFTKITDSKCVVFCFP